MSASLASGQGTIAIGNGSEVYGQNSAVVGGMQNEILNDSLCSAIVGGKFNTIRTNSSCSVILGGSDNHVSANYCVSAGKTARATNDGAFVWADSTSTGVGSWGSNTMLFMASGGVRFQSGTPSTTNNRVQWVPGDASWQFSSDRNLKEGFVPVDSRAALEKVAALPMTTWHYKGYSRTHIGVMAQDFYAAFPLEGASDTMIDSADLQGASLAAIKGLHAELKAERARNDVLEARIKALEEALTR